MPGIKRQKSEKVGKVGSGADCRTRKCRAKKFEFYPLKLEESD